MKSPVLCLLCGKCFCVANRFAHAAKHAHDAHGGQYVSVFLGDTRCLFCAPPLFRLMPTLFVDAHGEADIDMRRGRPLTLDRRQAIVLIDQYLAMELRNRAIGSI